MATPATAQIGLGGGGGAGAQRGPQRTQPAANSSALEEWGRELRETDPVRRLDAVKALSTQKDEQAIEYLIEATADEDLRVRLKAIDCLGNARASAATPVLVQSLYLAETESLMKRRVLVALGKIGDSRAAKPIGDYLAQDHDIPLVGTAVFALGEIGAETSLGDLQKLTSDSKDDRIVQLAKEAIDKINLRKINPEVQIRALRNDEDDVRPATASAAPPLAY